MTWAFSSDWRRCAPSPPRWLPGLAAGSRRWRRRPSATRRPAPRDGCSATPLRQLDAVGLLLATVSGGFGWGRPLPGQPGRQGRWPSVASRRRRATGEPDHRFPAGNALQGRVADLDLPVPGQPDAGNDRRAAFRGLRCVGAAGHLQPATGGVPAVAAGAIGRLPRAGGAAAGG